MEFQFIVVTVALIVLVVSLILVYLNMQNPNIQFPRAMTNCPDYWKINEKNGNCIIPSEDIPHANIGNLKGTGKPYFIYNDNNTLDITTDPTETSIYRLNSSATPGTLKGIPYTPYDDNNYKVYSYSSLNIPGYIDASITVPKNKRFSQNVNNMKLDIMKGNEINFNDNNAWLTYEKGTPSICNIKNWLNSQNIEWDGMRNYGKCL